MPASIKPAADTSPGYAWYVVGVLFFLNMSASIDRFIIGIVVIPIKGDLQLSDTMIGLLQGFAFALLYCLAGIPLGRLADVASRRAILFGACAAWTLSTACSAFAQGFWQLFAARLATGLAEAALVPASLALISAYIPRQRLGVATSIFVVGASAGKAVAFTIGGIALGALTAAGGFAIGDRLFRPWQALFLLAAAPALIAAAALLTVREPKRVIDPAQTHWGPIIDHLRRHRQAFCLFALMGICIVLIAHIFAAWAPSFFVRRFALPVSDASMIVGIAVILVGPAGGIVGGWLTDRLTSKGISAAAPLVVAGSMAIAIPATALFVFSQSLATAIVGYCLVQAAAIAGGTQSYAGIQLLTPAEHRGLTSAIYLTVSTLAALVVGPLAVGLASDYLFTDPIAGLGYSIFFVLAIFAVVGLLAAKPAARHYALISI